ncbi:MAG: tRNA 2-selenouridine(34) synthase MnmH [Spirochaetes bacterium]|nr:MAG: tRNA 2-selenouridine(34) synthase MnmH [Spirochaetota bacterium]
MNLRPEITYPDALLLPDPAFVDVRAPVEYGLDHIPGAVNIPVLDDGERAEIGTMYRIHGQEKAILKGTQIVGEKLSSIVEEITRMKNRDIVIYCFRGGMRSSSLVSLLDSLGIPVRKLTGGYKGYRNWVRSRVESLDIVPPVFALHGLTGTGKTLIVRALGYGIDLEYFAGHRSSLFGGIGLTANSQKTFESLLVRRVDELAAAGCAVIEGESRKIGDLHVPGRIVEYIGHAPAILITASLERRVEILMEEYSRGLDCGEILGIIQTLETRIGHNNAAQLRSFFEAGRLAEFTAMVLEKYYDPLYKYSLDRKSFIARVENRVPEDAVRETDAAIREYLRPLN